MITDWFFGYASNDLVRICARSTVTGQFSVVCNDRIFLGSTITSNMIDQDDTGSTDGLGYVDVIGLASNNSYSFEFYQGGSFQFRGSLKSAPSENDSFNILITSCIERIRYFNDTAALEYSPTLVIYLGDTPYCDSSGNDLYGDDFVGLEGVDSAPTMANWFGNHRQFMNMPSIKNINQQCHVARAWDDHELCDNWDNSWEALWSACDANGDLNAVFGTETYPTTGPEIADAEAATAAYKVKGTRAYKAYAVTNPVATNTDDTDPLYFWFDYGSARIFVLDLVTYKSAVSMVDPGTLIENDSGAKTIFGLNQKAWFKTEAAATPTDKYIIIISSKEFFGIPGRQDGMRNYVTERDDIANWIGNNLNNVFVWVGDMHYTHGFHRESPFFLQANASPANFEASSSTTVSDGYGSDGIVYKYSGHYSQDTVSSIIGIQKISPTRGQMILVDTIKRRELWKPIQVKGSNALTYEEINISL